MAVSPRVRLRIQKDDIKLSNEKQDNLKKGKNILQNILQNTTVRRVRLVF